ncbi:uncharacterized protein [Bemisia tabaci]|uniref:uncharacterized protein n=1 Tax=Bemisia tabaci TaxID=7038 RepID=UPI003B283B10
MRLIYITGLFAALLSNLTLVTSVTQTERNLRASLLEYHNADTCHLQKTKHAGFKASLAKSNCEKALNTFLSLCVGNLSYQSACHDPKRPAACDKGRKVTPRCSFQCRESPDGAYKTKHLKDIVAALNLDE